MKDVVCYNIERLSPRNGWMKSDDVFRISKALTVCLELCNWVRESCADELDKLVILNKDKFLRKSPWIVERVID